MSSIWNRLYKASHKILPWKTTIRNLNLQEYQSKNLLRKEGVAVQKFCMVDQDCFDELKNFDVKEYVIKAQILAGGRGKGHFDNGFKGGVHITEKRSDIEAIARKMLGAKLITKQTPKEGILVRQVMIAESVSIKRETYVCILMDGVHNGPVVVASPAGGMDIEAVAAQTPHLLRTIPIDIHAGLTDAIADEVAAFLGFRGALRPLAAAEMQKLWRFFRNVDAIQLEINPLVETGDARVVAVDAKIGFDDNAQFRHREIFALDDGAESDPRELEAARHRLNYIAMGGNIGCLVNGAGLAMATMDIIALHGGAPANFLDVGGSVQEEQVRAAFRILTADKSVRCILVNVFGGIVNCATIANGIVGAMKTAQLEVPLIVRLEGTNAAEARRIIRDSGLEILTAEHLDDAAKKAVSHAK